MYAHNVILLASKKAIREMLGKIIQRKGKKQPGEIKNNGIQKR